MEGNGLITSGLCPDLWFDSAADKWRPGQALTDKDDGGGDGHHGRQWADNVGAMP